MMHHHIYSILKFSILEGANLMVSVDSSANIAQSNIIGFTHNEQALKLIQGLSPEQRQGLVCVIKLVENHFPRADIYCAELSRGVTLSIGMKDLEKKNGTPFLAIRFPKNKANISFRSQNVKSMKSAEAEIGMKPVSFNRSFALDAIAQNEKEFDTYLRILKTSASIKAKAKGNKRRPDDYSSGIKSSVLEGYREAAGGLPVPPKICRSGLVHQRNRELAEHALLNVNYTCEIDSNHETFTSSASNQPYVEAHHLVPLSKQDDYRFSLDVAANVVALCPMCHKHLHHGIVNNKKADAIKKLFTERKESLKEKRIQLTEQTLLSYYSGDLTEDEA